MQWVSTVGDREEMRRVGMSGKEQKHSHEANVVVVVDVDRRGKGRMAEAKESPDGAQAVVRDERGGRTETEMEVPAQTDGEQDPCKKHADAHMSLTPSAREGRK